MGGPRSPPAKGTPLEIASLDCSRSLEGETVREPSQAWVSHSLATSNGINKCHVSELPGWRTTPAERQYPGDACASPRVGGVGRLKATCGNCQVAIGVPALKKL